MSVISVDHYNSSICQLQCAYTSELNPVTYAVNFPGNGKT